jgi:hypothetical protein
VCTTPFHVFPQDNAAFIRGLPAALRPEPSGQPLAKGQLARLNTTPGEVAALFVDVNTEASRFVRRPAFVTSVETSLTHLHWRVSGAGALFLPRRTGFRLYLQQVRALCEHCRHPPLFPAPTAGLHHTASTRTAASTCRRRRFATTPIDH